MNNKLQLRRNKIFTALRNLNINIHCSKKIGGQSYTNWSSPIAPNLNKLVLWILDNDVYI